MKSKKQSYPRKRIIEKERKTFEDCSKIMMKNYDKYLHTPILQRARWIGKRNIK